MDPLRLQVLEHFRGGLLEAVKVMEFSCVLLAFETSGWDDEAKECSTNHGYLGYKS